MKASLALLTAALVSPAPPLAAGLHGQTCDPTGATPLDDFGTGVFPFHATLTPENGWGTHVGSYNPVKFTFALGPGEHDGSAVQAGDSDVIVCKAGALQNRHACLMSHLVLYAVQCGIINIGGSPGFGTPIFCDDTIACNYVMYIFYCAGVECNYPADVPYAAIAGVIV